MTDRKRKIENILSAVRLSQFTDSEESRYARFELLLETLVSQWTDDFYSHFERDEVRNVKRTRNAFLKRCATAFDGYTS